MKKTILFTTVLTCFHLILVQAQVSFESPGSQTFCSTRTPNLDTLVSDDYVKMAPSLRLEATCLDSDLTFMSFNSPAFLRKPTFCYNNGYFPDSLGFPVAISRNSTANAGNCAGGASVIDIDFSHGVFRPRGLSFIACDIDNSYDTFKVEIYSGGTLVNYNFEFLEPNTDSSYAYTKHIGTSGSSVHFNGGANGVWGESSKTSNWAKGAILFTVDSTIAVDSVIITHYIKNNRNDINAGISFGKFTWIENDIMSTSLVAFNVNKVDNIGIIQWTSSNNHSKFTVEKSNNGHQWEILKSPINTQETIEGNLNYKAQDENLIPGNNFYRLRIDENGQTSYSTTKLIQQTMNENQIQVFPNPSNGILTMKSIQVIDNITITNSIGQIVVNKKIGTVIHTLDIQYLPKGIYHLSIQQNNNISQHKINIY